MQTFDLLERLGSKALGQLWCSKLPTKYLIAKTLELNMGNGLSETHNRFAHRVWGVGRILSGADLTGANLQGVDPLRRDKYRRLALLIAEVEKIEGGDGDRQSAIR